jgi:AraC family transcriptional regulator
MQPSQRATEVEIVEVPATRVAVLTHVGDESRLNATIRKFVAWRKQNGFGRDRSDTFNVLHMDSALPAGEFRMDLCVSIDRDVADNDLGIVESVIPKGRCAVLRLVGGDRKLGAALAYLVSTWLPASGEQRRDFPVYLQRVEFGPDVAEEDAVTCIYLPLR